MKDSKSSSWGSVKEVETLRRIKVTLWAYAYEMLDVSLVSDQTYDQESLDIDLSVDTDRPDLDKWFRENYSPNTGMWVRSHPDLRRIHSIYSQLLDKT